MLRLVLLFCVGFAAAKDCGPGFIVKPCSTGITKTCSNMNVGVHLSKPCFDTCVCPGKEDVYSESLGKCVSSKLCPTKGLQCENGLIIRSCGTGITQTCLNWFEDIHNIEPCIATCGCIEKGAVYHPEIRKCVQKKDCIAVMEENRACEHNDPNSEMRGCIKRLCGDTPCLTKECRHYCVCKQGFILSDDKKSCIAP